MSIFLFLIILFIHYHYYEARILSNQLDILTITPTFEKVETKTTSDSAFIKFQIIDNYIHEISYQLYISEFDLTINPGQNLDFFRNWEYNNDDFLNFYDINNSVWKSWVVAFSGKKRIVKLTNLKSNSLYRLRYVITSKYGISNFSKINYIRTKRVDTAKDKDYAKIYIKGTGRNNHDNALVTINDTTVLRHGKFQGLCLIVLNRINMGVISIEFYDTINSPIGTGKNNIPYTKYQYNKDGSLASKSDIFQDVTGVNSSDKPAFRLLQKLNSLNESNIFILVSCYGWEKYFTPELADILARYGALNILEMKQYFNFNSNNQNTESILNEHHYYHPYAFIGIPNIGPGKGFESLRSNKGHYLSVSDLPTAELLVKLKFNKYARNYYFAETQYNSNAEKFAFVDDFEYLHNSKDYSLRNLFPLLLYANMTTDINFGFNIYDANLKIDKLISNTNTMLETELERVVLGSGIGSIRKFTNNTVYQNAVDVTKVSYYDYYVAAGVNGLECRAPYTANTPECPKSSFLGSNSIPILFCKIGLNPNICLTNDNYFSYVQFP
jgi:hypothetical protein